MLLCDLNCDMGEGMDNDEALMPYISSANVACGYHAGNKEIMKRTVDVCMKFGVAIGAHPSYKDRENFGRKDWIGLGLRPEDVKELVMVQVISLQDVVQAAGGKLHHVKPHGALYNRAAWDSEVAAFVCAAIKQIDPNLILYGLSGSQMKKQAEQHRLTFRNEVFADRSYQDDGSLTPRSFANALIEDEQLMLEQVLRMVNEGRVKSVSGKFIDIQAETVCIHGDGKHAVNFARKIYNALQKG